MSDWVSDVTGESSDDSDDDSGSTLFEDNFRQLVEDGDVESLNVQTIEDQLDQIDDEDLLLDALDLDTRTTANDAYHDRLSDLEDEEEAEEEAEPSDEVPNESPENVNRGEVLDSDEVVEVPTEDPQEVLDEDAEDLVEEVGEDTDRAEEALDENTDAEDMFPDGEDDAESDAGGETTEDTESDEESTDDANDGSTRPSVEVDVSGIAPDATPREDAVEDDPQRTMLVWGEEGTGKTHVAHTAPGPIAYIDTEGKADDIAEKFEKPVYYFQPDDYQDATDALEQAFDLLDAYRAEGVTGTVVVDSITKMWDWAKQDYQELAFPSADDPSEVDFKSALQGEDDWAQIKRRHNTNFRDRIIESPYHVVFTAMAKEDYNAVIQGADGKPMTPDGEKQNPYVVKDVLRLRSNAEGKTVADLHKAAKTRYSFVGLEWPEWDDVYEAIEQVTDAEQAPEPVDVSRWDFDVIEGRPANAAAAEGSDETDDE